MRKTKRAWLGRMAGLAGLAVFLAGSGLSMAHAVLAVIPGTTPPPDPFAAPAATITSPNGGEVWSLGSVRTIRWTVNRPEAFHSNVTIEFANDGRIHSTITSSAPLGSGGSGAYEWELPVFVAYGNTYRVRVTALRRLADYPWATGVADESDFGFTISDGGKIAFASEAHEAGNTDIYVLDAGGVRRLATDRWQDVSPAWSPDGTKIVFSSRRDGNEEVYVMNGGGASQRNLTRTRQMTGPPRGPRMGG